MTGPTHFEMWDLERLLQWLLQRWWVVTSGSQVGKDTPKVRGREIQKALG